jgi:HEPN domain-containing protein
MRATPREEGERWLQQARIDLKWALHLHQHGAAYLACFLAQQVAEKALKAFLYAQGEEVVIGHSVRQLAARAAAADGRFAAHLDAWAVLDSFYIPTRYPNGLPGDIPAQVYNRETAAGALSLADQVVTAVGGWFSELGEETGGSPRGS